MLRKKTKPFKEILEMAENLLNTFCKAYQIPTLRESDGELPNLTPDQIGCLFMMLPEWLNFHTPSEFYMKNRLIPGIIKRQNSEPKWWLKQICLYLREHGV